MVFLDYFAETSSNRPIECLDIFSLLLFLSTVMQRIIRNDPSPKLVRRFELNSSAVSVNRSKIRVRIGG